MSKNVILIGVDYSLNSPAVCIYKNNNYNWISYPVLNKTKKEQSLQTDISKLPDVNYTLQDHFKFKGAYEDSDLQKMIKYDIQAGRIIQMLKYSLGKLDDTQIQLAFEGYSYGSRYSKTDNIIELAAATTLFKKAMLSEIITETDIYKVYAPKTIKKIAGNGNMKKRELFDVFTKNLHQDKQLENSFFWDYCRKLTVGKKVPSPVDDMIDAYFVIQALLGKG